MINYLKEIKDKFGLVFSKDQLTEYISAKIDTALHEERRWNRGKSDGNTLLSGNSYIEGLAIERQQESIIINEIAKKVVKKYGIPSNVVESLLYMWGGIGNSQISTPTAEEVKVFQQMVASRYQYSPTVRNAVDCIKRYTVGKGVIVECSAIPDVNKRVSKILKANTFDYKHKIWVQNTAMDGEIFIAFYFDYKDDMIWIEHIDPRNIVDIERHPKNNRIEIAYMKAESDGRYAWYQSIQSYMKEQKQVSSYRSKNKFVPNVFLYHIKEGDPTAARCVPRLYPVLKWIRVLEELDIDLATMVHERVRIPWIKSILGAGGKNVSHVTDKTRGAAVKVENANQKWRIEDAKLNQINWRFWGRPFILRICSGLSIPEFILFMDSSGQNYSSFRKADSPFVQMIMDTQDSWSIHFKQICRVITHFLKMNNKIKDYYYVDAIHTTSVQEHLNLVQNFLISGMSRQQIQEILESKESKTKVLYKDIPFDIIFPSAVGGDSILVIAQAVQILVSMNIMSKKTAAYLIGLNSNIEQYNMNNDPYIPTASMNNTKSPRDQNSSDSDRSDKDYQNRVAKNYTKYE